MKTYEHYYQVRKWMGRDLGWQTSAEFLIEDDAINWGMDLNRRGFESKVVRIDR